MKLLLFLLCLNLCSLSANCQKKITEKSIGNEQKTSNDNAGISRESQLHMLNTELSKDSNNHNLYLYKATILASLKRYEEAIEVAKTGVEKSSGPGLEESLMFLGILYDVSKNEVEAKKQYTVALNLYKQKLNSAKDKINECKLSIALISILLGDDAAGQKIINELIAADPHGDALKFKGITKAQFLDAMLRNISADVSLP